MSFSGKKTKVKTSQEEKDAVQGVKEDLMAKEILVEADAEAAAAKEKLDAAVAVEEAKKAEIAALEAEEADASTSVARAEKVVSDIANEEWTTERVFAAFDKDLSGTLDTSELQLAMTAFLEREISLEDVDGMLTTFDVDKDGVISFDEFSAIIAE
jgi:hypothetical protein